MASNTNIGASQQGPGLDIGASQTPVVDAVTSDQWTGRYPSQIVRKIIAVALIPSFFYVHANAALEAEKAELQWRPNFYDNPVLPRDNRWTYPSLFPDVPLHENLEPEKAELQWRPNFYDNPVLPRDTRWTYPSFFAEDLFEVPGVEEVLVDKWFVRASEPLYAKPPKPLEGYFEPPSTDALEPEISRLGWRPNFYDNPVLEQDNRWTYPYFFGNARLFVAPAEVLPDMWHPAIQEPVRVVPPKPLEGYAEPPSRTAIEAETAALGWRPNFFDNPILPRDHRWTYPFFMADADLSSVPVGPTTFEPKIVSINLNIDQGRDLNLNIDQGRSINLNRC